MKITALILGVIEGIAGGILTIAKPKAAGITIFVLIGVLFSSISSVCAETAEEYNNRGIVYDKQGSLPQAISDYTKAIEIKPYFAKAYSNRGVAYYKQGKLVQAILDCTKAIEINPSFAEAYNNRGLVYAEQNNFTQAISDYTKAIEINPDFAEAYCNRGITYYGQGNYTNAISDYTKAIQIDNNFANAHHNRGLAYYATKDYDKALNDMCKVEELGYKVDPTFLARLKEISGSLHKDSRITQPITKAGAEAVNCDAEESIISQFKDYELVYDFDGTLIDMDAKLWDFYVNTAADVSIKREGSKIIFIVPESPECANAELWFECKDMPRNSINLPNKTCQLIGGKFKGGDLSVFDEYKIIYTGIIYGDGSARNKTESGPKH